MQEHLIKQEMSVWAEEAIEKLKEFPDQAYYNDLLEYIGELQHQKEAAEEEADEANHDLEEAGHYIESLKRESEEKDDLIYELEEKLNE